MSMIRQALYLLGLGVMVLGCDLFESDEDAVPAPIDSGSAKNPGPGNENPEEPAHYQGRLQVLNPPQGTVSEAKVVLNLEYENLLQYAVKIGPLNTMDCLSEVGYLVRDLEPRLTIDQSEQEKGVVKLCLRGRDKQDLWQSDESSLSYTWDNAYEPEVQPPVVVPPDNQPSAVPELKSGQDVVLEAEGYHDLLREMDKLKLDWQTQSNNETEVSAGKFLQAQGDKGITEYDEAAARAMFRFNSPAVTVGVLWVRCRADDGGENSFYVTLNGKQIDGSVGVDEGKGWYWHKLELADIKATSAEVDKFNVLELKPREPKVMIDKLVITTGTETPVGLGPDVVPVEPAP